MGKRKYIDSNELRQELIYCHTIGKPSEKLMLMFYKIATEFVRGFYIKDSSYDYNDGISEGFLRCVEMWEKFDTNLNTDPFSYFSQTVYTTLLQLKIKSNRINRKRILTKLDEDGKFYLDDASDWEFEKYLMSRRNIKRS